MTPWRFLLLAAAAFRTWKLLADDAILDRPRDRLLDRSEKLDEFVSCPWCLGFWLACGWWAAHRRWPDQTAAAAEPWALSAAVGLIATHREPPD